MKKLIEIDLATYRSLLDACADFNDVAEENDGTRPYAHTYEALGQAWDTGKEIAPEPPPLGEDEVEHEVEVYEEVNYRFKFRGPKGTPPAQVRLDAMAWWLEHGDPTKHFVAVAEREFGIVGDKLSAFDDEFGSEIDIQVFGMKTLENGDQTIAKPDEVEFWDVLVRYDNDELGEIEVIEEHENLTAEEASQIEEAMIEKYPNATTGEWVTA